MSQMDKLDQINIYASSSLSSDDIHSLTLLYSPLIGGDATMIFEVLYSLLERNGFSNEVMCFYNLCDLLGVSFDAFENARLKLEAIGLLETFYKDSSYVFLLKQPLTANQFLNDSTLGIYLESKIGDKLFTNLVEHFEIKKFDKKGYENITVSFDDVFETESLNSSVKINGRVLGRKPNTNIQIKNHKFDFDKFASLIDDSHLEYGMSKGFKKLIIDTSYVYAYDEDDMALLYNQSLNKSGVFDSKMLKKKALVLFQYKHNNSSPSLKEKEEILDKNESLMNLLAETSVEEILTQFYPGYPPTYLSTINEIYDNIDLDREVLNILIFSILKDKKGVLPTLSYFKKASITWHEQGITTKERAWEYIQGISNIKSSKKEDVAYTGNKKQNVKTNDWVEKYKENIGEGMEKL